MWPDAVDSATHALIPLAMSEHSPPQKAHWPEGAIFTLGHSTLPIQRFLALLQIYGIDHLVDIRTIPRSRHNPQFNDTALANSLTAQHLEYLHIRALGGLRRARKDSPNIGWRNGGFRGYADYMQTEEFQDALEVLIHTPQRTHRDYVRRSGAMAMPPFACSRRAQRARVAGGRDFIGEQLPDA